ncbi:hypothetical protein GHK48_04350 [Sinorhizobium fredii]|uniref:Uncharacterized protein n=1 Tax=Rhizobium fredii TaxID=380 RepID=A0A844A3M1_RHIFR|nr:hypothetical protein [Sinorhizobium fredii]CCE99208.1 hypothetical protein SFHH103_04735 [Sinorhizobium fredii HH103]CEO91230.1 hypothetical protein SFHH103_psfHH103d_35 [Sinorhizobium fredii HH103]
MDGRTGVDVLKRGRDGEVVAAAEGVARGDFSLNGRNHAAPGCREFRLSGGTNR